LGYVADERAGRLLLRKGRDEVAELWTNGEFALFGQATATRAVCRLAIPLTAAKERIARELERAMSTARIGSRAFDAPEAPRGPNENGTRNRSQPTHAAELVAEREFEKHLQRVKGPIRSRATKGTTQGQQWRRASDLSFRLPPLGDSDS
jgi:hypothetical protein